MLPWVYCYDAKHQIILPYRHDVTNVIIQKYHKEAGHLGQEYVLSSLRQLYWIIKGRSTVAHNCHGNNKYLTAIINTSRQNQKCRGEIKFPVSAPQFEQNILELMWTQPQQPLRAQLVPRTHGYNSFLWFWFCRELFAFAASVFGFAVSFWFCREFLLLPLAFCFCPEFLFCRELFACAGSLLILPWVFGFAVSFLVLPWAFWFCRARF